MSNSSNASRMSYLDEDIILPSIKGMMNMKEIKNLTNFDGIYAVADGGAVYMRINYGGFYEWYEKRDHTFVLLEVSASPKIEQLIDNSRFAPTKGT